MPDGDEHDEQIEDEGTETNTDGDRPLAGAAAKSALDKERKARRELESKVKELLREKTEREEADLSENERLKGQNARLQAQLEENEKRDAARTREGYVIRAAKEFTDPDEAVAILARRGELDEITSEKDAERVLKALAKDRPHLLRKQAGADDASHFEQVLVDGQPAGGEKKPGDPRNPHTIIPADQLAGMSDEEQRALKASDPALYWRSVEALNGLSATTHTVV